MNELMDALNSVQPDFEMANEWMEHLCKASGVESCEELTLSELEKELAETTVAYENVKVWGITGNKQFVATLLSYMDWLNDLILDKQMEG